MLEIWVRSETSTPFEFSTLCISVPLLRFIFFYLFISNGMAPGIPPMGTNTQDKRKINNKSKSTTTKNKIKVKQQNKSKITYPFI